MKNWLNKLVFNLWPCYWGSGGRITFIADDYSEIRVKIPLSWRTKNYVGTIYGGSMYGAIDPVYMLMLLKRLGEKEYIVWDKAADIRFLKPGKQNLFAQLIIDDKEVATVKALLQEQRSIDRVYTVQLKDKDGVVCAEVDKTLYIRKKQLKSQAN